MTEAMNPTQGSQGRLPRRSELEVSFEEDTEVPRADTGLPVRVLLAAICITDDGCRDSYLPLIPVALCKFWWACKKAEDAVSVLIPLSALWLPCPSHSLQIPVGKHSFP